MIFGVQEVSFKIEQAVYLAALIAVLFSLD